jgi:hypothetical protein
MTGGEPEIDVQNIVTEIRGGGLYLKDAELKRETSSLKAAVSEL